MDETRAPVVLSVRDLHTHFFLDRGVLRAINGLSIELHKGEILGLIGETGSGKSVTAKSLMGRVPRPGKIVSGEIRLNGENLRAKSESQLREIRGRDIAIVVQNPHGGLNPFLRVKDQIANVYRAHRATSKKEADEQARSLLDQVGIPDARRRALAFPHELSGGMAQRVAIAAALSCAPAVLLADEPTTGLDVIVQKQVLDLIIRLVREQDSSMILITHDLGIVAQYCDTVAVMFAGQIVELAAVQELFEHPLHPYTMALIGAMPDTKPLPFKVDALGQPPDVFNLPEGCYFQYRCPFAKEICFQPTSLEQVLPGHLVRCHLVQEGGDVSAFASERAS